ncbi:hypothetical protein D3C73_965330 [compost metagenome]
MTGNEARLEARSEGSDFQGEMKATITDESLRTQEVQFTSTAPGEYTATLPIDKPGVYLASTELIQSGTAVGEGVDQQVVGRLTTGFVIPYSPEYRITANHGAEKLNKLAELTGGRLLSLDKPEDVFNYQPTPYKKLTPIGRYLLILALLLFLVDIAIRRVSVPKGMLASWSRKFAAFRSPASVEDTASSSTFSRLNQRKDGTELKLKRGKENPAMHNSLFDEKSSPILTKSSHTVLPVEAESSPTFSHIDDSKSRQDEAKTEAQSDSMSRLLAAKQRNRK